MLSANKIILLRLQAQTRTNHKKSIIVALRACRIALFKGEVRARVAAIFHKVLESAILKQSAYELDQLNRTI